MTESSFDLSWAASLIPILCCLILPAVLFLGSIRIVPEGKRIRLYRLGRYAGDRGPGLVLTIPIVEKGVMIDLLDRMNEAKSRLDFSGLTGETLTPVQAGGSVLIGNEPWSAVSKEPIPAGEPVRVVGVVLEIEPMPRSRS